MDHIYSGALAGIMEHTVTLPLKSILERRTIGITIDYSKVFRGAFIQTINVGVSHAWYYHYFNKSKSSQDWTKMIYYSSIAKIGHELISFPFETIRVNMNTRSITFMESLKLVHANKGYFKGIIPLLCTGVPQTIIEFGIYNTFDKDIHPFLLGMFCGFSSSILMSPFDRLKIYRQYHQQDSFRSVYKKFLQDGKWFNGSILRMIQAGVGFWTLASCERYFK